MDWFIWICLGLGGLLCVGGQYMTNYYFAKSGKYVHNALVFNHYQKRVNRSLFLLPVGISFLLASLLASIAKLVWLL